MRCYGHNGWVAGWLGGWLAGWLAGWRNAEISATTAARDLIRVSNESYSSGGLPKLL